MATVFDELLLRGVKKGQIPARTQNAREWYRDAARRTGALQPAKLVKSDPERGRSQIRVGDMYLYHYDPKYKKTLPYYDRFPLVFPFKKVPKGWLGINMHYLPLQLRAKLMDNLYDLASNRKYDETTRLRLNYEVLNGAAKFRLFKPTIHRYLISQVESRMIYINPSEWDIALFLPLERFYENKGRIKKGQVYKDSRQMIRGS